MKPEKSLRDKTISATAWTSLETFSRQGIRFVIGIVLARLLAPADYGLIAMVMIFNNLAGSVIESGLTWALVQKKDATQIDFSTSFIFNVGISIVLYFLLFFTSPIISAFYKEPQLTLIVRIISLNFIISSFSLVQHAILSKKLDFKTKARISIISTFISGSVAVYLAYHGFGVWALVFQSLLSSSTDVILLWSATKWKPTFIFSTNSFRGLFNFGSKIMVAGLINSFFNDIHSIVIGKIFSPAALGLYSRGEGLSNLPMKSIYGIYQKVFFPVFATIQDQPDRLLNGYKKSLQISSYIIFPLMFGFMAIAEPFVSVLLTDKWIGAVPYLQLFCLISITYPLSSLALNLINVKGRADLYLKLEIIKKLIIGISLSVTFQFGVMTIVIGQVISSLINLYLNLFYCGSLINYSAIKQLKELLPVTSVSVFTGLICFGIVNLFGDKMLLSIILSLIVGFVIYFLLSKFIKLEAYNEIIITIKSKIPVFLRGLL